GPDRFQTAREVEDALASSRLPPRRRRLLIAVGAIVLASTVLAAAYKLRPRLVAPAENVVAIFPFTVRGAAEHAYLGDAMVELLSLTLGSGSIRHTDPNALLALLKREGWQPDPERAREVARRFGAKKFVLGSVLENGPRVLIQASLYDADAAGPIREVKAEGELARLTELVDQLTGKIRLETRSGAPAR